jgi:hypothetical protein
MRRDPWLRRTVQVVTQDGQTMRGVLEWVDEERGIEVRFVQYVGDESPPYPARNAKDDIYAVRIPVGNLSFYTLLEVAA